MDAIQAGLGGLQAAEAQLDGVASRIARQPLSVDDGSAPLDVADLSSEAVAMMTARTHFQASLKVIEMADEMQRSTLNLLA
jgi:flagellar hook protein FlgE